MVFVAFFAYDIGGVFSKHVLTNMNNEIYECIFVENWTSASTYPRVPVRVEIMGDKQLSNGSLYTIHHVYDFFNLKAEEPDSRAVFQVKKCV